MTDESLNIAAALKVLSKDMAGSVQFEIAKRAHGGAFAEGWKLLAPWMRLLIEDECKRIGIENKMDRQATRSHVPYYRRGMYMTFIYELLFGEGCWQDDDFVEDTLRHHPELRCKIKYGCRGQEYVSNLKK